MNFGLLDSTIKQYHLETQAPEIHALAQEGIFLTASPLAGSSLPVGSSRLGGTPDTPGAFIWPQWQGAPMSFIAQIRLQDIAHFPPASGLPDAGLLLFFYNQKQDTYGDQPSDRGSWAVIYLPPSEKLEASTFPGRLPQSAQFKPLSLRFSSRLTLPVDPRQVKPDLHWSDEVAKQYEQLWSAYPGPEVKKAPQHQMFGYPDQLQDDMQLQSAQVSQGITAASDPRAASAAKQKSDWRLLLQVDSDDRAGMRWGSYGMIYYWMRDQDVKARHFDQAWLVEQSD